MLCAEGPPREELLFSRLRASVPDPTDAIPGIKGNGASWNQTNTQGLAWPGPVCQEGLPVPPQPQPPPGSRFPRLVPPPPLGRETPLLQMPRNSPSSPHSFERSRPLLRRGGRGEDTAVTVVYGYLTSRVLNCRHTPKQRVSLFRLPVYTQPLSTFPFSVSPLFPPASSLG